MCFYSDLLNMCAYPSSELWIINAKSLSNFKGKKNKDNVISTDLKCSKDRLRHKRLKYKTTCPSQVTHVESHIYKVCNSIKCDLLAITLDGPVTEVLDLDFVSNSETLESNMNIRLILEHTGA